MITKKEGDTFDKGEKLHKVAVILGSVWIELIFAKTENTSKIIFKCVNSAMRSIFNEKVAEK